MSLPACNHPRADGQHCPDCGACMHDVILNGACVFCGETDVDPSPKQIQDTVPAGRLRRSRRDSDDSGR